MSESRDSHQPEEQASQPSLRISGRDALKRILVKRYAVNDEDINPTVLAAYSLPTGGYMLLANAYGDNLPVFELFLMSRGHLT